MALPSSCNSSTCASQIGSKHRGICPSGWHIPSDDEWATQVSFVESDKGCTDCAGKHLKAKNGWNDYEGKSGSGLDSYGFSALPGGRGLSDGSFTVVGFVGFWLSASEDSAYYCAASRDMNYNYEGVGYSNYYIKSNLYSVRCLKD